MTDSSTFDDIKNIWIKEIQKNCGSEVEMMLLGNKCDIPERQVSYEEASAYAKQIGMLYFETSAKEGTNIEEAFITLT